MQRETFFLTAGDVVYASRNSGDSVVMLFRRLIAVI